MFYGLSDSRTWADNTELPTPKTDGQREREREIEKIFCLVA
ncbi:hypothetical protein D049_5251 [Vibrio parahaemolyticus VPTS-2010]|nr:hypothetical protein D049_5251 [Vibrio parahaemolyticus VPTS-2010]